MLTFLIDYRSQTGRESQLWLLSKIEEVSLYLRSFRLL